MLSLTVHVKTSEDMCVEIHCLFDTVWSWTIYQKCTQPLRQEKEMQRYVSTEMRMYAYVLINSVPWSYTLELQHM